MDLARQLHLRDQNRRMLRGQLIILPRNGLSYPHFEPIGTIEDYDLVQEWFRLEFDRDQASTSVEDGCEMGSIPRESSSTYCVMS